MYTTQRTAHTDTRLASPPQAAQPAQRLPTYDAWRVLHDGAMQRIHDAVEARGGTIAEIDTAQHAYLNAHPYYEGVFVSPGASFEAELEKPPKFTTTERGELAASLQGEPWAAMPVREVLHLPYHRLVVVSTDAAVYVLTADEWSAQV